MSKVVAPVKYPERREYQRGYYHDNREKKLAYSRSWYATHKEQAVANGRSLHRRYREQILEAYGRKCACCGETEPTFLTVDHVENDGKQHRERFNRNNTNLYRDIVKQGFPPKYRLLCFNCNSGRRLNGGSCPHAAKGVRSS